MKKQTLKQKRNDLIEELLHKVQHPDTTWPVYTKRFQDIHDQVLKIVNKIKIINKQLKKESK